MNHEETVALGAKLFREQGYFLVKDVISKDLCKFLTHVLLRKSSIDIAEGIQLLGDPQVPNCLTTMDHEILFDTILEKTWPLLEQVISVELLPTYSYARLYTNGNILEPHSDRPACEISMTVQLGRSHHYSWPIYVNNTRFDLAEGDAIIYKGCDYTHWREECNGPPKYYSGQVFLHYVDAKGPYKHHYSDCIENPRTRDIFVRYRDFLMEDK